MTGVLLLLVPFFALPRALAGEAIEIAAAPGFADTLQADRWAPLSVTVTNHGEDVSGELEVEVTGGDELRDRLFVIRHRREIELPHGSRKTLQFTVFPSTPSHPLVIRLYSHARALARAEVDLRTRFTDERLLLVLGRDANLDYLNDDATHGLRVLYPHPELLPEHWRGYDAVAAIVLHGISLERLSAHQFDALRKWIAHGGILAVSGGPDYGLLRTPRLSELLPARPQGLMRVDAGALQRTFSNSLDVSRPVHVNRLGAYRGRALLHAGEAPLIVERTFGLGRVLYLTFDVVAYPFDRWKGMRELWLNSLQLPQIPGASTRELHRVSESALAALVRTQATDFPSAITALLFLTLYLGLLLAGYRLPTRRTRLRMLAPLWGWAAPLIFVPAAWLLFGSFAYPRGATAVTLAVIEPFPDSVYAQLAVGVGAYSNRSGTLRLEYAGAEPMLYPARQGPEAQQAVDWIFGESPVHFVQPSDRQRYVFHALEGEDVIAFNLKASLHDETAGPRIVLDNATGQDIEDLRLVFDGYAYEIGAVAPGERLERDLARREHGIEVGEASWEAVVAAAPGLVPRMRDVTRIVLERLSRAAGANGYPGTGEALLVGYTASPLRPSGTSADWPRRERGIVVLRLAATPRDAAASGAEAGTLIER